MLCVSRECIHPSDPRLSWDRGGLGLRKPAHRQLTRWRPARWERGQSQAIRLHRHRRTCGVLVLGLWWQPQELLWTCVRMNLAPFAIRPALSMLVSLRNGQQAHIMLFFCVLHSNAHASSRYNQLYNHCGCSLTDSVEVCCRALFNSQ